jgi:anaerobic selenocysteine-containing dehydrogenase
VQRRVGDAFSPVAGRDVDELMAALRPRVGPERLLDLMLRCGPYGDHFGARPGGLTLAALEEAPHGLDFGPLEPRVPGILRTPSGKIELAPPQLLLEIDRLDRELGATSGRPLLLIGRREQRSMNSWLHNLPNMSGGPARCTVLMHAADAASAGVEDGTIVRVSSRVGAIELPLEVSEEIMPGVVSIPHGWGHKRAGTRQHLAVQDPGASVNVLTDRDLIEPLSGTAVLNGVPVTVTAVDVR